MTAQARLRIALFVLLFALGACSGGPALPRVGPTDVILAFGDSLTYGTGATEEAGGRLEIGEETLVVFRASIDPSPPGTIANQAVITAAGARGAPALPYPTDGDVELLGQQPQSP